MPQVASDTVVQRPLRPEPLSGRAGASAGEPSSTFEGLLDTAPAAASRPAPPERTTRARSSDRSDQARPADDRSQPRTETRASRDSSERTNAATDKNSTKPADTPNTAKNGLSSDANQPVANQADASSENTLVAVEEFAVMAGAITVEASGETKPAATGDMDAAALTTDQPAEGSDEANVPVVADATTADVAAVIVAVAVPVPALANVPATEPAIDPAAIKPIELQAAAPATPADGAPPGAPVQPADTPATTDISDTAPAKPQVASDAATAEPAGKTAPANDSQKAAALKAAGLSETPETKSPASADHKAESGKTKSDQHGGASSPVDARAPSDAARPADGTTAQAPKPPGPREPHAQVAEHTAPAVRSASGEPRAEIATASAGPAQVGSNAPALPFSLAAPALPFASPLPVTALRVDAAADNAVPVAGIAVEIVSRAQDGLRRFDIRLDPPELGRIDVRLDVDSGGKVTSRLIVERTETLDLLRRDAPQLERALQHAGLNTEGGLEFSLRDQNFANRDQAPRETAASRLIIPDDELAATEAARRGYGRMIGLGGGVDIRV